MFTTCQNLNTHSSPMQAGCKRWNKPFLPSTYRPRPLRRSFTTPPVAAVAVGAGTNPSPFPAAGPPPPGYTRRSLYSCIGKVKRGISTKPLLHRDFWVVRQTSGQNQMNRKGRGPCVISTSNEHILLKDAQKLKRQKVKHFELVPGFTC
jgi:hypothetical protein